MTGMTTHTSVTVRHFRRCPQPHSDVTAIPDASYQHHAHWTGAGTGSDAWVACRGSLLGSPQRRGLRALLGGLRGPVRRRPQL